ncbi:TetR/AcrR family transcriptional regulator C-terminal domain-containing protein, partial [Candidatus Saccharibacteria bacterium]|nr:TetR/AcrR family transcriptional regulator C-terminal domain-containing protein [Candidatus Saccharibacteria bacterium]
EFNTIGDVEQYVNQIFTFLRQQESVYRQLLSSDAPTAFLSQLESGMTQRVFSIIREKGIEDKNAEFELLILTSGTFAILRKYYRNEVSVTLKDIHDYLSYKLRIMFERYVK